MTFDAASRLRSLEDRSAALGSSRCALPGMHSVPKSAVLPYASGVGGLSRRLLNKILIVIGIVTVIVIVIILIIGKVTLIPIQIPILRPIQILIVITVIDMLKLILILMLIPILIL